MTDSKVASLSEVLACFYEEPCQPDWTPPSHYAGRLQAGFNKYRGAIVPELATKLLAEGVPAPLLDVCFHYLGRPYGGKRHDS